MPETTLSAAPLFSETATTAATGCNHGAPHQNRRQDFHVAFIHSLLDDYGLSSAEFRIYGHLVRRAGRGEAWPSIKSMARVCNLHPQTVRHAVANLIYHRLINRTFRSGLTPLYTITKASCWRPPTHVNGELSETDTPPSISEHTPAKPMGGHPSDSDAAKGDPVEENPRKANPHSPPKGDSVMNTGLSSSQDEEISLCPTRLLLALTRRDWHEFRQSRRPAFRG